MARLAWLMTFALSVLAQGAAIEDGLRIRALIDGADLIKISSRRLWYEHESFDLPGKWHGHDEPTFVNGEKWTPTWDGKTSSSFESAEPLLPLGPGKRVLVERVEVRGKAFVLEQPSEANDQTVTIYLDDRSPEGGAWYEVVVRAVERNAEADATGTGGPCAWQQITDYRPPHFESFFPDGPEGGRRLDAFASRLKHDSRPDEEILEIVRNGLRRTTKSRRYILRDVGNRYIWGKNPQHPTAIEIMYHAADFGDQYGTRHYAVYFGLSVIRPPKPPAVLRTLAEICMMGQEVDRVTWGCKQQLDDLRRYLEPYHKDKIPKTREMASVLDRHFKGEIKFRDWQGKRNIEKAKAEFGDRLPEIKETLLRGSSKERRKVVGLLRANYPVMSLMDDSFIDAWVSCATDPDPKVREDVPRLAGNRWIWGAKDQKDAAIGLMLELSEDESRSVRYNAVYFGLSTVSNKDETVVRRLIEIAMEDREPNMYRRICWGLKRSKAVAAETLDAYLSQYETDPKSAVAAYQIYEDVTGRTPPHAERYAKLEASAPTVSYVVVFGPKKPFDPKDGAELLHELEGQLPDGINTHDFGWRKKGDQIGAWVIVDRTFGRDAVKKMLSQSPRLALIRTAPVTPQVREHLRRMSESTKTR